MANGQLLTTIADSDWRLVSGPTDPPVPGNQFVREVQNIDASVAESLRATAIATVVLTDPYIDNVKKTGSYYLSDCVTIKQEGAPFPGSATLRETLTKIVAVSTSADLTNPITVLGSDLVEPFALKNGTQDMVGKKYLYLAPSTQATIQALSITAPVGYTEVQRRTLIEDKGDRTCTLNILYQKMTWTAWTNGTPDRTVIENSGRNNERRTRYWYGIRNADATTALTAVKDDAGASAVANFHVLLGDVEDNKDGSVTVRQIVVGDISEVANVTARLAGTAKLDPFSLVEGDALTLRSEYGNQTATDLGSIVDTVPSGYTFLRSAVQLQNDGLYTKVFEYEKRTWTAWTGGAANRSTYENYGRQGEVLTEYWYGIQKSDKAAALSAVQVASGSYRLLTSDTQDNKDGSITVIRRQVAGIVDSATALGANNLTGSGTLDPFAYVSGTSETFRSVYRNKLDSELPLTETAPSGYTLLQSRSDIDDNGLFTKTFEYEKRTWVAWTNGIANRTIFENSGRNNERRTRYWYGIQKADAATALAAVQNDSGASAVTGFHVVLGDVEDNKDGSVTVRQIVVGDITEVANVTARLAGAITVDPFALVSGDALTLRSEHGNQTSTDLTAISETTPSGYTLLRSNTQLQSDGLYTKVFEYEKRTWTGSTGNAANRTTYENYGRGGERMTQYWYGIPKADAATALTAMQTPVASYRILSSDVFDNKDGSVTAVRVQVKAVNEIASTDANLTGTDVINPFALQSGTVATYKSVYLNKLDSELPLTEAAPASYTLLKSDSNVNGDGLFQKTFYYEKRTWTAWTAAAADRTVIENSGRDNESRTRYWYGIQKADIATALAYAKGTPESGFQVVSGDAQDNGDGSITVIQSEIGQIIEIANVSTTLSGLKTYHPLGLKTHTVATLKSIYANHTASDLAAAVAAEATPTDYTLVDAVADIDGNGLYRKTFYYEKPTGGTAWGGAPDLIEYYDVGSKASQAVQGESSGIIKTWTNIKKDDLSTAIAAIRDGTGTGAADTGYIILKAEANDNQDGTITFRQVSEKQVNNKDVSGQIILNPLGFYPGTLDSIETIYRNFTATDIGAITETAPLTYTLKEMRGVLQGNGLYSRTYYYIKATWTNTTPTGKIVAEFGAQSDKSKDAGNIQKYFGIPIANTEANIQTLKLNTDDTNYLIQDVRAATNEDTGETIITRTRKKVNTAGTLSDYVVAQMTFNNRILSTGLWVGVHVYWPSLLPATADALMTTLATTTSFVFAAYGVVGSTFKTDTINRKVNEDGSIQVDLVCVNEIYMSLIEDGEQDPEVVTMVSIGDVPYRVTTAKKITSSLTLAKAWCDDANWRLAAGARNENSPIMPGGHIKWLPLTRRYEAVREKWTQTNTYT